MIELHSDGQVSVACLDGVVRDVRQPLPDDGLLPGAVFGFGDHDSGPRVSLTIERRLYPRKAPIHMHKSDTFRMALGEPIIVGRTSYCHSEFRLQETDTFYGPELWTDEVGTNQLLIIADRRGAKPYLAAPERQGLVDQAVADDATVASVAMHERDARIEHHIVNNIGAQLHAGHWDAGFTMTGSWPELADGTRLAVIAFGEAESGPLLLCWDRPPGAVALPEIAVDTDVLRLIVHGSCILDGIERGRLGFRLQAAGVPCSSSKPGSHGVRELWCLASRSGLPMRIDSAGSSEDSEAIMAQVSAEIETVLRPLVPAT